MDLTEKVARAIARVGSGDNELPKMEDYIQEFYRRLAPAAIAVCAEEMAREIESRRRLLNSQFEVLDIRNDDAVYEICAATIRSMGVQP